MAASMPTDSITRRFAVAWGVLSQHVRNNGAPVPPFLKQAPPGPAATAAHQEMIASSPQQLTILYGGRVVVLDACPPERAAELIRLAAAAAQQGPRPAQPPEQALVDMPIARKASLRRFLAKRKDRSSAYEGDEPPAPKKGKMAAVAAREEPSSSWLALGSLCSMHGR